MRLTRPRCRLSGPSVGYVRGLRAWRHPSRVPGKHSLGNCESSCPQGSTCRAHAERASVAPDDELGDLSARIDELAQSVDEGLKGTSIFLIGMMGSGKSTVGRVLANVLKYCFFDSDTVLEAAVGGATVAQIFEANGEAGFRDLEASVLSELSAYRNCVIATGGGVVERAQNWGAMQVGVTVYLEGPPELLARRVVAQSGGGATRPLLAGHDDDVDATAARLAELLRGRESSYRNADCCVSLRAAGGDGGEPLGASAAEVVCRVLDSIDQKIRESAAEREERQKFEIRYTKSGDMEMPNMVVPESYTTGEGLQIEE